MENGEDEDEDDLSEASFYQSQLHTVQLRNKLVNQQSGSRAPTMTIDVVRVGRPLKILALLLSLISILLFIVGSVSTSWIHIHFKSIGLFQQCDSLLKQFNLNHHNNDDKLFMNTDNNELNEIEKICQFRDFLNVKVLIIIILDLIALILATIGSSLLLSGIFSLNIKRKRTFYHISIVLHILSCITILSALIILVIECMNEANQNSSSSSSLENQSTITVGWSLIIVCFGIFILGISVCLVLFDRGGEEIEYRETIHRSSNYIGDS
ncbi:hypothetical protein MS3_00004630 [Schistosoma haematobium]|uniref:Transmembrane protein n=1 Tax=Schistosoma haematobium TaxID=6185 RepID=A0A094ZZ96_SCHHA|nr:hypothetical protein MS3_00004630 [Schistosoma haematobium]KAH9592844.1 hypothetical protein MS3_00004630 [Schistosoma haematobium]CAH8679310.1 unnamed protein product [Schistosoma haematobium]CAH8681650.1 unnamed protein product [Schistosoma haematobium]